MESAEDLLALAVAHHQAGNLAEAAVGYGRVLALQPDNAAALSNLGAVLQQQGRLAEAEQCYRRAIAAAPELVQAHGNLGTVLKDQGQIDAAIDCYRRAIEMRPDYSITYSDLGVALQAQGKLSEAIQSYRRAIELNPAGERAWFNLGTALSSSGELDEAIACYRQAIALRPNYFEAFGNLGNALKDKGQLDEAIACHQRALEISPGYAEAYNNLAGVLQQQKKLDTSIAWYRGALTLNPHLPEVHSNLGTAFRELGKLDEAIACHQRAIELQPNYSEAFNHLGTAWKEAGDMPRAIAAYRQALAIRSDLLSVHENLLFALQFAEGFDAAAIFHEHQRFDEIFIRPLADKIQPHPNERSPNRRLKIGYLSPDFYDHCQAFFTIPLLSNHDHQQFEIFCYADVVRPDEKTDRLRGLADQWRNIIGLTPDQAATQIRADQIDILVDLTMHMQRGHPLVLARKPAPIQVCWLAYPGTSGISTIDYRLTDPHLDPPDLFDRYYTERSLRLPDTFWCYDPLTAEPPTTEPPTADSPIADSPTAEPLVNPLPALEKGHITFGSLNNFCKTNATTFKLWSRVLAAVEGSRLMLLADEGSHRQRTLDMFAREGIAPDRIRFISRQLRLDYLRLYHEIDIGLDTIPYNGHTTSLDAYWMGVPVVTLVGPTVVGRAGLSQLTNLGLTELIAHTADDYVAIAARLAADRERLAHLRSILRSRMEASPLMDAARFTRAIESSYRSMWREWCSMDAAV